MKNRWVGLVVFGIGLILSLAFGTTIASLGIMLIGMFIIISSMKGKEVDDFNRITRELEQEFSEGKKQKDLAGIQPISVEEPSVAQVVQVAPEVKDKEPSIAPEIKDKEPSPETVEIKEGE